MLGEGSDGAALCSKWWLILRVDGGGEEGGGGATLSYWSWRNGVDASSGGEKGRCWW